MDEVAVSSVDFNEFEAGFEGAASALAKAWVTRAMPSV